MDGKEFLLQVFKGDQDALALVVSLNHIAHVWDDLIDKDKPVSNDQINALIWAVLGDVPTNPFYFRHFAKLQPLIENALVGYMTANELEKGDKKDRVIAFTLRYAGVVNVVAHMIHLVGGREWAAQWCPQLWRLSIKDDLSKYLAELEVRYAAEKARA